ncbi:MAG: MBL fold metallo-hydrolase [Chitinophagaceae bacterium]
MLKTISAILLLSLYVVLSGSCRDKEAKEPAIAYNNELLQRVRAAATAIPGNMPVAIGYLKYAESLRKWSDLVEGGSNDPAKMARTAFQIQYPDGWIMVDAGMDKAVHHFFEKDGPQPFDQPKADSVRKAVEGAKLILITHEHGDHVAGVVRTAATGSVPRKTILTRQQVDALINEPQMPEIALTQEKSRQYIVVDLTDILPVAPGVVLIRSPGHTQGEIMIYTRLQNGQEYIFTGDVSWVYQGVAEKKQKPKPERERVGEDESLVGKQLAWLNELLNKERITILVSHDDIMLPQFAAKGLLSNGFVSAH